MDKQTVTIPRLENERAERYEARVTYITMGPNRSLDLVAQKLGKSSTLMARWSSADNWTEHATNYDNQVSYLTVQEAQESYRADLADYRKRYGDMGRALYGSAAKMLKKINASLDDPKVTLGASSLLTALNAAKTAADLEALSLRVESLLNSNQQEDTQ